MGKIEIAELERQIKEAPEKSLTRAVGDMLRDMAAVGGKAAELLAQDMKNKEMSIQKCADQLTAYAKKNQKAGCYWMSQEEARGLICGFYGIPEEKDTGNGDKGQQTEGREKKGTLELPDLFDLM